MNQNYIPLEVLEPLSYVSPDQQISVECDTGYRCITGKVTY